MKLLLTAFDPFGGEPVNPALEAVKKVQNQIGSVSIVKLEVPTVFGTSIQTVAKAIEQEMPDAVLCIGQAGGRPNGWRSIWMTPVLKIMKVISPSISPSLRTEPRLTSLPCPSKLWCSLSVRQDFPPAYRILPEPLYAII